VVFTSVNGVGACFRRLQVIGKDARAFAATKLAAVGSATAASLEQHGITPDFVPDRYLTQEVATGLAQRGIAGARVLLPRTDLMGEDLAGALSAHGAQVDQVIAYRTVQASALDPEIEGLLRRGEIDIATFASSSTVTHLIALLKGDVGLLSKCAIACIGPITAKTATESGLRVDVVAQEHTIPGLVAAIVTHSERR
ncbi:MAG TPA: uroporphyrinogen-III synthase, partial [Dehalococcoidia bacterium]|nr:uroporphyrinogen-III synthase [Dehalococcoidia bacterium]